MGAPAGSRSRSSPAKLNLTLAVGPKRADGFHAVESLVTRIALCDDVRIGAGDSGVRITSSDPTIPTDSTNLAHRAAVAFARAACLEQPDVAIHLEKRIPAGAGLGGGSSNAATVLRLLAEWTGRTLPPEAEHAAAAQLGSDVPLFLGGPLCVARGRGELLESVPERLDGYAVVILPAIRCPTAAVYARFDRAGAGALEPARLAAARARLADADALMPLLFNDLERAAFALFPALEALRARAQELAGGPVRMSGSGSALFRLYADAAAASAAAARLRAALDADCRVARLEAPAPRS